MAFINVRRIAKIAFTEIRHIVSQVVIGASLGSRFAGLTEKKAGQSYGSERAQRLCYVKHRYRHIIKPDTPQPHPFQCSFNQLLSSGILEMTLITLTLGTNPTRVSLHDIYRILIRIVAMSTMGRKFSKIHTL